MNKLFSAAFCGILSLPLLANEAVVSNSAVGWVSHQRLWQDQNSLDFTRLNGSATFGVPIRDILDQGFVAFLNIQPLIRQTDFLATLIRNCWAWSCFCVIRAGPPGPYAAA